MLIDKKVLRSSIIHTDNTVEQFVSTENARLLSRMIEDSSDEWFPPIFLFCERDEPSFMPRSHIAAKHLYGGGTSKSVHVIHTMDREILEIPSSRKETDDVTTATRGNILSGFCQIEFCIDSLICYEMGIFEGFVSNSSLFKEMSTDRDGLFNTFNKKLNYLKHKKMISRNTYELLQKAKSIRNNLAHQYLPSDQYGISQKDIERYGGKLNAISCIYEGSWYFLLTDFSKIQNQIINWLAMKTNV